MDINHHISLINVFCTVAYSELSTATGARPRAQHRRAAAAHRHCHLHWPGHALHACPACTYCCVAQTSLQHKTSTIPVLFLLFNKPRTLLPIPLFLFCCVLHFIPLHSTSTSTFFFLIHFQLLSTTLLPLGNSTRSSPLLHSTPLPYPHYTPASQPASEQPASRKLLIPNLRHNSAPKLSITRTWPLTKLHF